MELTARWKAFHAGVKRIRVISLQVHRERVFVDKLTGRKVSGSIRRRLCCQRVSYQLLDDTEGALDGKIAACPVCTFAAPLNSKNCFSIRCWYLPHRSPRGSATWGLGNDSRTRPPSTLHQEIQRHKDSLAKVRDQCFEWKHDFLTTSQTSSAQKHAAKVSCGFRRVLKRSMVVVLVR